MAGALPDYIMPDYRMTARFIVVFYPKFAIVASLLVYSHQQESGVISYAREARMKLHLSRFRVRNFRNIDDSGWIPVERVTAFVGRNESGKTALLKALHKFNPATPEPHNPQREFPRDRYLREFKN